MSEQPGQRLHRWFHVVLAVALAWLGMMIVHEAGHVVAALVSGGEVHDVILYPITFSRTDVQPNPHPLLVAWGGFVGGIVFPLIGWIACAKLAPSWKYIARSFAGFCLIANGAYVAAGAVMAIADGDDIIRHGSPAWLVIVAGLLAVALGLRIWHNQSRQFGFGKNPAMIGRRKTVCLAVGLVIVIVMELVLSKPV